MVLGQVTFDSCDNPNYISSNTFNLGGHLPECLQKHGKLLRIRKQHLQLWVRISTLNISNWLGREKMKTLDQHKSICHQIRVNGKMWIVPQEKVVAVTWSHLNSIKHTISKGSTCWEIFNNANLSVLFPTPTTYNSLWGDLPSHQINPTSAVDHITKSSYLLCTVGSRCIAAKFMVILMEGLNIWGQLLLKILGKSFR